MGYHVNVQIIPSSQFILPAAPCLSHLLRVTPHFLTHLGSPMVFPPSYLVTDPSSRIIEGVEYTATTTCPLAITPSCFLSRSAKIDASARLIGACLVGENCSIGPGVVVQDSVLGDNCVVGAKTRLRGTVVLPNVHIGGDVFVDASWISSGVCIHDGVRLGPRCFVGIPKEKAQRKKVHSGRLCIEKDSETSIPPESILVASEGDEERDWIMGQHLDVNNDEVGW